MTTEFRTLTDVIQAIAKRGTDAPPTTERAYYAHCLFTKASLHARSIVSLCDSSLQREEQPDVGGICVLARCLIEVRNATSYILESNISKNEAHLRLHLVSLNQSVDLLRVTRGLETNRDDFWSEHSITYSRGELAGNPIFAALDPNQKKYLLRGKSPFQQSRYRGKRPLSAIRESAIYTLLSHSAHAYALGLSGFAGYGSATPADTLNSFLIATQAAQIYLADTARTYCRFRRRALGKLTDKEASLFERCSEPIALNHLLKDIRAGVTK